MRLFVAIELPEEVKDYIGTLQADLPAKLRFVPPSQCHITLAFFPNADTNHVKACLSTLHHPKFNVHLDRLAVFPSGRSRIVSLAGTAAPELIRLSEEIYRVVGVRPEKPFNLHATIARVKSPVSLAENLQVESFSFFVEQFVLYSSVLTSEGPRYTTIETFSLH